VASNFPEATLRADNRNDGTVDVLIGAKTDKTLPTTGFASSIAVPNGNACLPKAQGSTTPSATPSASKT
jgi:hypothetical protein